MPRTGTASMKRALEQLGIGPCFHLAEPATQFKRIQLSAEVMNTSNDSIRKERLSTFFQGFEAALEQPASGCLLDMLDLYPNAKVSTFSPISRHG